MNNHTIFNLKYWVTIWQGAALILNIDPSEVIDKPTWHSEEQIYGIGEVFGDENNMPYFSPDKTDLVYQETMNLLIDGCCEWDGWFTVRGSKINPGTNHSRTNRIIYSINGSRNCPTCFKRL
jgi:hypothetical protein